MIERFPPKLAFVEGKQRLFNERSYLVGIVVGEFQSTVEQKPQKKMQYFYDDLLESLKQPQDRLLIEVVDDLIAHLDFEDGETILVGS